VQLTLSLSSKRIVQICADSFSIVYLPYEYKIPSLQIDVKKDAQIQVGSGERTDLKSSSDQKIKKYLEFCTYLNVQFSAAPLSSGVES
jgi:hypothetical protein